MEQEIKFDRRNYRRHNDENKRVIKKSLKELGAGRSIVVDKDGEIIAGNGVYEQARKLGLKTKVVETDGSELVVVKRTDLATEDEKRKRLALADNAASDTSEWAEDLLREDWTEEVLKEFGVELPEIEDDIEEKKREFEERMKAGEISEEDEEYQEFVKKFELKKTTDDCYTPAIVYDAVANYVEETYGVSRSKFVRPFYPGGDYKREKYPKGCVVVDNPPFSILAEILTFYGERGIAFFLFAPTLTLFSSSSSSACALPCGVQVTYENGANVTTSFLTSFEADVVRVKSAPKLYAAVKAANEANLREQKKELPKYVYPPEVVTSTRVGIYSRLGIDFVVPKSESVAISRLDAQKEVEGKTIYGKGYLLSERVTAERERAERERVERWQLSDREKEIIKSLNPKDYAKGTSV